MSSTLSSEPQGIGALWRLATVLALIPISGERNRSVDLVGPPRGVPFLLYLTLTPPARQELTILCMCCGMDGREDRRNTRQKS